MSNQTVQIKISTEQNQGVKLKVVSLQGKFGPNFTKAYKQALKQRTAVTNCDGLVAR